MGKIEFNYRSEVLGYYVDVSVVYPTDNLSFRGREGSFEYKDGMKFQTIYLLHGGGDDASLIYRYSNAERYAQDNCVMLVSPSLPNSFFVNTIYGVQYGSFVCEELPRVIQSLFASSPKREDNFLMGYAMGGSGSLAIAARGPELFTKCIAISGGVNMGMEVDVFSDILINKRSPLPIYLNTFGRGEDIEGSDYDLPKKIREHIAAGVEMPEFMLIAGSEEGVLRDSIERESKVLTELGCKTTYLEMPGHKHDFRLWDLAMDRAMSEWLPLTHKPIYL